MIHWETLRYELAERRRIRRARRYAIAVCLMLVGLTAVAQAQVPAPAEDGHILWERPASELTQSYEAPAPYGELWRKVGTDCLQLAPTQLPPLAAWSFYSVNADAFWTVWDGPKVLSLAVTDDKKHRIYIVHSLVSQSGAVAHEMLHAMLLDLGRTWKANHPSEARKLPMAWADSVFSRCKLWPIPEQWP